MDRQDEAKATIERRDLLKLGTAAAAGLEKEVPLTEA